MSKHPLPSTGGAQPEPQRPSDGFATMRRKLRRPARQQGTSLLEALVASIIVAVGLLATAQWQIRLREAGDLARQQAEALRQAQHELEGLRAYASRQPDATLPSYDEIGSGSYEPTGLPGANARYQVERMVQTFAQPAMKALAIRVHWLDPRGSPRSVQLDSLLPAQAPALILALGQPPAGRDAGPLLGRHAAIPREAQDLGDGRSVFKPRSDGQQAWLFEHRNGRIVARCDAIDAGRLNHRIGMAELSDCRPLDAVLLSGRVRFALVAPPATPEAATARDAPLPLAVELALASSGHPTAPICDGESVKLVQPAGSAQVRLVAADALPVRHGLPGWQERGEAHWQFHCAVNLPPGTARASAHWAGQLRFIPIGWTFGSGAGSYGLCRYSADTDGSGAIDRPAELPAEQVGVDDALVEQNYLVIDGRQACPTNPAATGAAGALPWSDANPATVPHSP